jgi:hypothetical protein
VDYISQHRKNMKIPTQTRIGRDKSPPPPKQGAAKKELRWLEQIHADAKAKGQGRGNHYG